MQPGVGQATFGFAGIAVSGAAERKCPAAVATVVGCASLKGSAMGLRKRVAAAGVAMRGYVFPKFWTLGATWGKLWQLPAGAAPRRYSPYAAIGFPPVVGCLQTISERLSRLPRVVERRRGERWVEVDDAESDVVVRMWGPTEPAGLGLFMLMKSIVLWGWGVVLIRRGAGMRVAGLRVLNPENLGRNEASGSVKYTFGVAELDRSDLAVLEWSPALDRVEVIPPLAPCWPAVRAGMAANAWAGGYYERGASGQLLYEAQGASAGQARVSKDVWAEEDRMREEGRRSLILPPGYRARPVSGNMREADVGNIVLTAKQAVCDVLGVPSVLLNDPSASTFSNKQTASLDFARGTLASWAERIGEELSLACWPDGSRRMRFDLEFATSDDRMDRVTATVALVNAGIVSVDEARLSEDFEALGGDYAKPRPPAFGQIAVTPPGGNVPSGDGGQGGGA